VARSLRENINQCILKDRIVNNPPKYTDARLGKPALEYCAWIKDDATWGGETEICILSEHFNVEITVVIMGDNATSITYGKIHPSGNGRIFLLYTGSHYDAIVGIDANVMPVREYRMFPAGDTDMSSLALAFVVTEFEKNKNKNNHGRMSADIQIVTPSIPSAGAMSQETEDMIQNLKPAACLTEEELTKVQDKSTMPTLDPDVTAGLGLTFTKYDWRIRLPGCETRPYVAVKEIFELSAANFASIMPGDVLLQIDDEILSGFDDVKRYLFLFVSFSEF